MPTVGSALLELKNEQLDQLQEESRTQNLDFYTLATARALEKEYTAVTREERDIAKKLLLFYTYMYRPPALSIQKFEVLVDGESKMMSLLDAAWAIDNGYVNASLGTKVMEPDGSLRDMTTEDRNKVYERSDRISEEK